MDSIASTLRGICRRETRKKLQDQVQICQGMFALPSSLIFCVVVLFSKAKALF